MKGVFGETTFRQLSVVVTIDKELDVFHQSLDTSREATRLPCQPFEIMPQVGIDRFHGIGFLLVGAHFVGSTIVKCVIHRKGIRIVVFGLRSPFQACLQGFGGSFEHNIPTQHAARVSIHNGQEVDLVFFLPTKVNNSSNSAFFTFSGKGALGN